MSATLARLRAEMDAAEIVATTLSHHAGIAHREANASRRAYWAARVLTYPACLRAELVAARYGYHCQPTRLAVLAGLFQPCSHPRDCMATTNTHHHLTEQGRVMRSALLEASNV